MSDNLRSLRTDAAPAPVIAAPYSQGIEAVGTRMVFVSGQLPLDPATNEVDGDDVATQTRRVLTNIRGVLEAGGATLQDVVKTTVFLADLPGDFGAMNTAYAEIFAGHAPARSTVGVAALPFDVRVEIEAIAVVQDPDDED